jgi:hypothetical protein
VFFSVFPVTFISILQDNHFMRGVNSRLLPVLLFFGFILLFGCTLPSDGGDVTADPYGAKLEALNSKIASASTQAEIASLAAQVKALESNISASGKYPDYLKLTAAQSITLEVLNGSILYIQEGKAIAASGVDCSKNYSSLRTMLAGMNSTKNSAISKVNAYLAINSSSKATLLLKALNNSDTEGMYLFTVLIDKEQTYLCPVTKTPAKAYTTPLNESEAVQLVVDEVVGTENYYVYSVGNPLDSGAIIAFSHPVKFVYVDVATGNYFVTEEDSNPEIGGISYWSSLEDRTNEEWVAYPENPVFDMNASNASFSPVRKYSKGRLYFFPLAIANVPAGTPCDGIDCCKGVGSDKALIVNGNDQTLFHTDTANMYDFLKNDLGMSKGDITYLTAKAGVPESDGVTTLKTFKKSLEDLAKDTECCDRIFIYITGHGKNVTYYEYKEKATGKKTRFNMKASLELDYSKWEYTGYAYSYHIININPKKVKAKPGGGTVTEGHEEGGRMWAEDITPLLNKLKSCYVTVMYDSCHSGFAAPWLAGRGRTIMTTSDKGSSWAYPKNKKSGKSAGGIWNTLWIMSHNTFKDSADKNNDGKVDHKEAYDYANKYAPGVVKAHTKKDQKGTITPPKPPCVCCDVICTENTSYLCTAVEGNGTIDPLCKGGKIGDYCGPATTTNGGISIDDNETENDSVTTGDGTTGGVTTGGGGTSVPAVCGDGNITGAEQCDHGSYKTNKCPTGTYCKDCECKKLETTAVCGDGKISAPNEDCDGGNVLYNVCPSGYKCHICKCIAETATCGDGTVTAPEECDHGNTYTAQCSGGNVCSSCRCVVPGSVQNQTHLECVNSACVAVTGSGSDECSTSADCQEDAVCGDGDIEGTEDCESDNDCSSDEVCSNCQ